MSKKKIMYIDFDRLVKEMLIDWCPSSSKNATYSSQRLMDDTCHFV